MIVDIANEVLTAVKTALGTVPIMTSYPSVAPSFPCVIFVDKQNTTRKDTVDSSGEKHNDLMFEIDIFSNTQDKVSQCRGIRNTIDGVMSGTYKMNREQSGEVPNLADMNIYRYNLRYSCSVDSTKTLYRR